MDSFLNLNLAPANLLLHPGILYSLFKDWDGVPLPEAPLFYESLSDDGARVLQRLDAELKAIGKAIGQSVPAYWMSAAVSLHLGIRIGYAAQIENPSTLRSAIVTNRAYQGIRTPVTQIDGGVVPDFSSRFLTEDVPHGLAVMKGCAEIVGVGTPELDRVLAWCQERLNKEYLVGDRLIGRDLAETAAPQAFDIHDPQVLVASCQAAR